MSHRDFRLSRYFSITGLIGIGVVITVLAVFYRHMGTHTQF